MQVKDCTKCTKVKPLKDFHRNINKPMGVESQCRRCRALYYNEYRKKKKAKNAK